MVLEGEGGMQTSSKEHVGKQKGDSLCLPLLEVFKIKGNSRTLKIIVYYDSDLLLLSKWL